MGGNKSTIVAYLERYEREQSSKQRSIINSIELPDAVHQAIANIKVKEIDALERANTQLKARIDEYLLVLTETEKRLASAQVDLEDAKTNFEIEKLKLEKQLAAVRARLNDAEQREVVLKTQNEQLSEQYSQARQDTAVAKKEVEMLREGLLKNSGG